MSGISTHAQRLAWQHADEHLGLEDDLPLEEQFEIQDAEFRHWDTFTFAPRPPLRLGGTPGANGAAADSSGSSGSGPAISSQPALLAGGAAVFPPSGRSALPFEHLMWSA